MKCGRRNRIGKIAMNKLVLKVEVVKNTRNNILRKYAQYFHIFFYIKYKI